MKQKNILFDQGRFAATETATALSLIESHGAKVSALIRKPKEGINQSISSIVPVYFRDRMLERNYVKSCSDSSRDPYDVLRAVLEHPSTVDIAFRKLGNNPFSAKVTMLHCLFNINALFKNHDIDIFISYVLPHSVFGWLCSFYCSYFNISHYFMRHSVLPNRGCIVKDGVNPCLIKAVKSLHEDPKKIRDYCSAIIDARRDNYEAYIPVQEKERRRKHATPFKSTWADVKNVALLSANPKSIWHRRQRAAELRYWSNQTALSDHRFQIAFFLHYQPERTTLPEAGYLSQQYIVAAMLSEKARQIGAQVLVKEHPSQIYRASDGRFRGKGIYEEYARLSNVGFVPNETEPPDLIKRCNLVVSCGGSVIMEALALNCPVLYFNKIQFAQIEGVRNISGFEDLSAAVDAAHEGQLVVDEEKLRRDMAELFCSTVEIEKVSGRSFSSEFYRSIGKIIAEKRAG